MLDARSALIEMRLPLADGKLAAIVRSHSTILEEEVEGDQFLRMRVRVTEGAFGAVQREAHGKLEYEIIERPPVSGCFESFTDEADQPV